jgi:hypothetical protein
MKRIKIWFSGMGGKFNPNNNFISKYLKKHFIVELDKNPDYLFYSVNSIDYLNYKCIRIFYTAENLVPDFNLCDYAIGFSYLTFADRYIRFPIYLVDGFNAYYGDNYSADLLRATHKHENVEIAYNEKTEFCAFVYSNKEAVRCRLKLFSALSKYKQVNSGGKYLNNVGGSITDKYEFQRKHKFVIACENSSTSGYTTEKIVHAYSAQAIPIYWGNQDIEKEFNGKSFINCNKFGLTSDGEDVAIDKIVDEVIRLDSNEQEYKRVLSENAFTKENNIDKALIEFEAFLVSIFEQNKDDAYRRNRYYWGKRYERKQTIGINTYAFLRKGLPIRNLIKRFVQF